VDSRDFDLLHIKNAEGRREDFRFRRLRHGGHQHFPALAASTDVEMLAFIDAHAMHGTGVGYVDFHLLAAVLLTPGSTLWSLDKRLHEAATRIGVAMDALH
jgi:hypothetical protein